MNAEMTQCIVDGLVEALERETRESKPPSVYLTAGAPMTVGSWSYGPVRDVGDPRFMSPRGELDWLIHAAEQAGLRMNSARFVMNHSFLRAFHAERADALRNFSSEFLMAMPSSEYRGIPFDLGIIDL